MVLTRRDWRGQENLPATGGCVVVTNHISHFDPLTFAHYVNDAGRAPRFLGKASVFEVPVVGSILRNAGQIPVYRESRDATAAFRAAVAAVEDGECVAIYPEATLTRDPDLWPMSGKTGAARVALQTGCPVIPIAQWGAHELLRPYAKVPHLLPRKTMHVWAGPPVDLDDLHGQVMTASLLRDASERIIDAVTAILAEIRQEDAPEERFDPRQHDLPRTGNPHSHPDHEEGR
jgi:1-acyl-sn-glycerol-3-phosphate acyltransferase